MPANGGICRHCNTDSIASWACSDCLLLANLCRKCMRETHMANPLHRIQRWTGTYFRRAELWEVGVYLSAPHESEGEVCFNLANQTQLLQKFEHQKDAMDQEVLLTAQHNAVAGGHPVAGGSDDPFLHAFQKRMENQTQDNCDFLFNDLPDDDEELNNDEAFHEYLPPQADITANDMPETPRTDAFNNAYVRIVHTNGLHHLAMIACSCRGDRQIAFDLIASGFMPASFTRIRTLFSCQLLDHFRLCNLELKASAYEYYNMLRRLTSATSPADVTNVAHEFRRMVRIWRWIKKLRWAGYGHNNNDPTNPPKGALANFCPACPQAGVNLPVDWKQDTNRYPAFISELSSDLKHCADMSFSGSSLPMVISKPITFGKLVP